jgi:hypothetical protein
MPKNQPFGKAPWIPVIVVKATPFGEPLEIA